jgi:uncharacterized protein (TIGR02391 family)
MIGNIQILRAIDEHQRQQDGRPLHLNAHQLLGEMHGTVVADPKLYPGFLHELFIARDAGYLIWRIHGVEPNRNDPNYYLQQIQDLALTPAGQDRARGLVVVQALPDPDDDDGHDLSDLILRRVADGINGQLASDQAEVLLGEEGLPPEWLADTTDQGIFDPREPGGVHRVLALTWRGGSEGRRLTRRFVGRWLDERLLIGPDAEEQASLLGQLARQGWQLRESDSVLVAADPVRGIPMPAPPMRSWRPHPLIESEARPQFLIRKPDQAVFAAMKAVEIRVRQLAGLGEDLYGAGLMNQAFKQGGPLADPAAGGKHNDGPRSLFTGALAMFRNPAGHTVVAYDDEAEAVEAVAVASALMRHLDRVEDRLLAAGRSARAAAPGAP